MSFKRYAGKTKILTIWPGDTANEVRDGGMVGISDSGTVVQLANDSTDKPLGVARRNDTVTDSALVPVEVPIEEWVEWEFDVDSDGGLADSDVGTSIAIDTAGGGSVSAGDSAGMRVDVSDVTVPTILVTRVISATKGVGVLIRRASTLMPDTGTISQGN